MNHAVMPMAKLEISCAQKQKARAVSAIPEGPTAGHALAMRGGAHSSKLAVKYLQHSVTAIACIYMRGCVTVGVCERVRG